MYTCTQCTLDPPEQLKFSSSPQNSVLFKTCYQCVRMFMPIARMCVHACVTASAYAWACVVCVVRCAVCGVRCAVCVCVRAYVRTCVCVCVCVCVCARRMRTHVRVRSHRVGVCLRPLTLDSLVTLDSHRGKAKCVPMRHGVNSNSPATEKGK